MTEDVLCDCGKHKGIGEWTPEDRAANYARIRYEIKSAYTPDRKQWLESWEEHHGKANYNMIYSHNLVADSVKKYGGRVGDAIKKPVLSNAKFLPRYTNAKKNWHEDD